MGFKLSGAFKLVAMCKCAVLNVYILIFILYRQRTCSQYICCDMYVWLYALSFLAIGAFDCVCHSVCLCVCGLNGCNRFWTEQLLPSGTGRSYGSFSGTTLYTTTTAAIIIIINCVRVFVVWPRNSALCRSIAAKSIRAHCLILKSFACGRNRTLFYMLYVWCSFYGISKYTTLIKTNHLFVTPCARKINALLNVCECVSGQCTECTVYTQHTRHLISKPSKIWWVANCGTIFFSS